MSRVLIGVEMLHCNSNHGLMDFSVPNLTMVSVWYQKRIMTSFTSPVSLVFIIKDPRLKILYFFMTFLVDASFLIFCFSLFCQLVQIASNCKWSDPVVELYAWSQLAYFAYKSADHDLVVSCTQSALQLDQTAIHKANTSVCIL